MKRAWKTFGNLSDLELFHESLMNLVRACLDMKIEVLPRSKDSKYLGSRFMTVEVFFRGFLNDAMLGRTSLIPFLPIVYPYKINLQCKIKKLWVFSSKLLRCMLKILLLRGKKIFYHTINVFPKVYFLNLDNANPWFC